MFHATVNQALEWLEKNQDTPLDELREAAKADDEDEEMSNINVEAQEGEEGAKSLVCNDCGKRFRNADLASYHASKTYAYMKFMHVWNMNKILTSAMPVTTPISQSQLRRSLR